MSIQDIINKAENITITRSKISGSTISRGGRLRSALVAGNQPYIMSVAYAPYQSYTDNRGMIEELNRIDLIHSEDIDIGSTNPNLSWLVDYQGDLSSAQIGQLKLKGTYGGNTIDIETEDLTGAAATDIMFKKGDYITFDGGYRYPYTVTADITVGVVAAGFFVSVPLSRPIIVQSGYTFDDTKGILVGPDVTWTVKMTSKPSFTVIPGRYIQVDGEFVFMEVIG